MNLSFHKLNREINERRYSGPEGTIEYKKLSPKMRIAIRDVYNMINKAPDPIVGKLDGIIKQAARKHNVSVDDIESYFDNEAIK
jgi:hypothetical protein|tara:strand:+ start:293 stop:544 length:252 start_codon:yes stop_codon:yes gene_type:complete